jgi:uncharacterized protein YodC (DUF2158 family)
MSKFKSGDRVQLKTGSPVMTVRETKASPNKKYIRCEWQEGKKIMIARFLPNSLEPAKKTKKS